MISTESFGFTEMVILSVRKYRYLIELDHHNHPLDAECQQDHQHHNREKGAKIVPKLPFVSIEVQTNHF